LLPFSLKQCILYKKGRCFLKAALITGASRGIGAAAARTLAAEGYSLVLNYHTGREEAESLAASLPDASAVGADISDPAQAQALVREAERIYGKIDLLVNNAGVAQQKLFTELTEEDWDRLFDVDVKGVFLVCRAALPGMLRRHQGSIVNVSSIWGLTGASCEVHYSAAKAAVIGLTKALAKEVGPSGIRVNCVAPGVVETRMNAALGEEALSALREDTPLNMLGTPEDIAAAIAFLGGEKARFITGQVLSPNGGFVI